MNIPNIEFKPFRKIPRYRRPITISEKIDGTSGTIYVDDTSEVFAASRNHWITPDDDNYGFAKWVETNREQLQLLGPGCHFGEWWGRGIQRNYGVPDKRFSLFNTYRFCAHNATPVTYPSLDPKVKPFTQIILPPCVGLVPVLYSGPNYDQRINEALIGLVCNGSVAAPGYLKPEGIVIYHTAANVYFKQTIEHDESPKGKTP